MLVEKISTLFFSFFHNEGFLQHKVSFSPHQIRFKTLKKGGERGTFDTNDSNNQIYFIVLLLKIAQQLNLEWYLYIYS